MTTPQRLDLVANGLGALLGCRWSQTPAAIRRLSPTVSLPPCAGLFRALVQAPIVQRYRHVAGLISRRLDQSSRTSPHATHGEWPRRGEGALQAWRDCRRRREVVPGAVGVIPVRHPAYPVEAR